MKEVLQSKTVVESNYSTDVGKFSVHVCTCREINAEKCDDKVTENEEVDMTTASSKKRRGRHSWEQWKSITKVRFIQ